MNTLRNFNKSTVLTISSLLLCAVCFLFIFLAFTIEKPAQALPPTDALYLDTTQPIEVRVVNLLSYMTLEEKIGQMALVENKSITSLTDISKYNLGGMLSGSGAKPEINTPLGWQEMINEYQIQASMSRLGIPLLYGADAIHGHAHVLGMTVFPHAIGLGATNNPELVRDIGKATAEDLTFTGINWNFAPNLDQPQDIRWGRVYEAYSDDTQLVSKLGAAYIKGLQSENNTLATAKHFLGLGGMQWNSSLNENFKIDQGVTLADETLLRSTYLPPFAAAVDAGVLSVMAGLNTWGDKRMVLQTYLLTDVLKQELDFKGFVVSDWYGVHEGRKNIFWATVQAINAGVDMVMLPFDYKRFIQHVTWANKLGLISDERIDDAVGRILYAKFSNGLFDENVPVGNKKVTTHEVLAREAVAQSLVLLKNEGKILPLTNTVRHIRVAGSAADNVGMQMGGWSIEWQGVDGNWIENGTSILDGIKTNAGRNVQIEYDQQGEFGEISKKADIGIAVVGEKPYAEGWGDNEYPTLSKEDHEVITSLQRTSNKVVVIIVSGRPLIITKEIDSIDALVVAWLPGSEGAGVADVLFGKKSFTGTLPLPWPSHVEQLPIAPEGATADGTSVLFPRYFMVRN